MLFIFSVPTFTLQLFLIIWNMDINWWWWIHILGQQSSCEVWMKAASQYVVRTPQSCDWGSLIGVSTVNKWFEYFVLHSNQPDQTPHTYHTCSIPLDSPKYFSCVWNTATRTLVRRPRLHPEMGRSGLIGMEPLALPLLAHLWTVFYSAPKQPLLWASC